MSASTDTVAGLDLGKLTPKQIAYLDWQTRWIETARLEQLPPDPDEQAEWLRRVRLVENAEGVKCDAAGQPWSELGVMAGRGFGKTRVGAEWLGRIAYDGPADGYYAVVAPTQSDVRFTCFEGESGLLNVIPKPLIAKYNSSDLILSLVNGAQMRGFSAEKAERLRGPQYHAAWCFIAGTMVSTPDGDRPIETLQPGDFVLTRAGPRRVLANSERDAVVGRVAFDNGAELVGTADHPVYLNSGWTRMDRLQTGDKVCVIAVSNGAGIAGTATPAAITSERTSLSGQSEPCVSTAPCGSIGTGPSPQATSSTTSTKTASTIDRPISSASPSVLTPATTTPDRPRPARNALSTKWHAPVAGASFFGSGALTTPGAASVGRSRPTAGAPGSSELAPSAVASSAPALETSAASVASTWRRTGASTVYCLKVEDQPEYFANGILVHNCDELAAWGKDAQYTWDMLMFGLRLGQFPRVMWTTTPKPVPLVRDLIVPKEGRIVVAGATFDNRKNLPKVFFDKLKVYEGTKIGRQELYGEMIDPEEAGIVRRSWINLWPANKPLPKLDFVVMSLDTAFTEETRDKKSGDADPTACGVWGVFYIKSVAHMILLDCWEERLGFPDLVKRVKKELKTAYGDDEDAAVIKPMFGNSKPLTSGRKPDMLLIEDKGSGISLRQTLIAAGLEAFAYNPGRADKLSRLHIVSPIFAQRRVWVPESQKFPGKPRTWCEPLIGQLCSFTGEGSIKHDDHVDQTTQAFRVLMDKGLVSMVRPTFEQKRLAEAAAAKPKDTSNPYAA